MKWSCLSFFLLVIVMFSFFACGGNFVYSEEKVIPNAQWTYVDSLDFAIPIQDTAKVYNLYLGIDHTINYPYQNIYLKVATKYPSGKRVEELLPIDFADKTGQWYGDCSGENCALRVNIQQRAFFNEIGTHHIIFEQYLRESPLRGIGKMTLNMEVVE